MVTSIPTDPTDVPDNFGVVDGVSPIYGFEGDYEFTGGDDDYLELAHDDVLNLAGGTYALTFNTDQFFGEQTLFSKDAKWFGDGGHLTVQLIAGNIFVRLQSEHKSAFLHVNGHIKTGEDYHLATSFGPEGMKLYLNGRLVDSNKAKYDMEDNDESLIIGGNGAGRTDADPDNIKDTFNGTISDFMVFGEQLDTDDVVALADAAGAGPTILGTDGDDYLKGTWNDDIILGKLGNDTIKGGKGDDTINGNDAEDGSDVDLTALGDMTLWLDAADVNGDGSSISDGALVSTWADKSGNGFDATAYGTINFDDDGYNGHASMNLTEGSFFDIDEDAFNEATGTIITVFNAEGHEDIVFYAANSGGITADAIFNGYGTTGHEDNITSYFEVNVGLHEGLSYTYQNDIIHNDADGSQLSTFTDHLSVVTYDKTNSLRAFEEGKLTSTQDISDTAGISLEVDTVMLGRHGSSTIDTHRFFSGDIAEVIVYDEVLSDIEIDSVFRYLSDKYEVNVVAAVEDIDILKGGWGKDVFVFSDLQYSTDDAMDVIVDFKKKWDKIDLSELDLDFGDLTITKGGGSTVVAHNDSEFAFELDGHINLTSADFIL